MYSPFDRGRRHERRKAIETVRSAIDDTVFQGGDPDDGGCCTRCGSSDAARHGRNRSGTQRFRCVSCGKVFTPIHEHQAGCTRLDRDIWMRYAEFFVDGISCREAAVRMGVPLNTAWQMRLRVIHSLSRTDRTSEIDLWGEMAIDPMRVTCSDGSSGDAISCCERIVPRKRGGIIEGELRISWRRQTGFA